MSRQRLRPAVFSLALGAAMLAHAAAASAIPAAYSAAEIRGWVVDAETKQPLEGVHVVAQWILRTGVIQEHHVVRLQILEAVTNASGEYFLPSWGPKAPPPLSELEWGFDPTLLFFKAGYQPHAASNYSPPPSNQAEMSQRISLWHGKTIALRRFRGSEEKWASHLGGVQIGLEWGQETDGPGRGVNDYWKRMPRIVLAIAEQRNLLPGPLRHRVLDLQTWQVTESQLRALITLGGTTP